MTKIKWTGETKFVPAIGRTLKAGDTAEVDDPIADQFVKQELAEVEKKKSTKKGGES